MAARLLTVPTVRGLPVTVIVAVAPGASVPTVQTMGESLTEVVLPWLMFLARPEKPPGLASLMPVTVTAMPATVLLQLRLVTEVV